MMRLFALVLAASCTSVSPTLPPLAAATANDVAAVRVLIDGRQRARARARWAALSAWLPANGATAYGCADALFSAGEFGRAFRLYHRILFGSPLSELDPQAQDSGAAGLIDRGLRQAGRGNFAAARQALQNAADRDPASIESRYFLGLVVAALGDDWAAFVAWKAAIDDNGYAQPPDGWTMPRAQEGALQRYLSTAVRSRTPAVKSSP